MNIIFQPIKLATVAKNIRCIHTSSSEIALEINDDKNIIMEAVNIDKKSIYNYANLLSDYRVKLIADYYPYNRYNIDVENLTIILKQRLNEELFLTVFRNWQMCYKRKYCIDFLRDSISKIIIKSNQSSIIKNINDICLFEINPDDFLISVCRNIINYKNLHHLSFKESKEAFGIIDTILSKDISKTYYLCCSLNDYLECSDETLLRETTDYSDKDFILFAFNFLNCIKKENINNYISVVNKLIARIGVPYSDKFNKFFSVELNEKFPNAQKTYLNSYSYLTIDEVFQNGKRGVFWKRLALDYDVLYCKYFKHLHSIVMKFENYYIIEFRDDAKSGALYFFSENYYEKNVKKYLNPSYNENEFKSLLLNKHTNKENFFNRIEHRGDWESRIKIILKSLLK